jgi:hypothetical protein
VFRFFRRNRFRYRKTLIEVPLRSGQIPRLKQHQA